MSTLMAIETQKYRASHWLHRPFAQMLLYFKPADISQPLLQNPGAGSSPQHNLLGLS
jgi:hypothetical protein